MDYNKKQSSDNRGALGAHLDGTQFVHERNQCLLAAKTTAHPGGKTNVKLQETLTCIQKRIAEKMRAANWETVTQCVSSTTGESSVRVCSACFGS